MNRPRFIRILHIVASLLMPLLPRLAYAAPDESVLRPARDLIRFISGPLAGVLVALGLAGALITLIFFGGMFIGRLLIAFAGGIGLFMLDHLVSFIDSTSK